MATAPPLAPNRPQQSTSAPRYRFSVEEYHRMAEAGIFNEDSRIELIEGDIIAMSPIGSRHASCVARLTRMLLKGVEDRAIIFPQNPVRLDARTEPQPDVSLLRPRDDEYASALPGPADVLLLIEVMDSSADDDRGTKLGLYARHGLAEVWLVDLKLQRIDLHRQPVPEQGVYSELHLRSRGQTVAPAAFPDVELGVDAILG